MNHECCLYNANAPRAALLGKRMRENGWKSCGDGIRLATSREWK